MLAGGSSSLAATILVHLIYLSVVHWLQVQKSVLCGHIPALQAGLVFGSRLGCSANHMLIWLLQLREVHLDRDLDLMVLKEGHACAQVMDLGSLNGTSLNGRIISTSNRRRGRLWRLNDGDEVKLGVRSTLKITYLPLQDTRVRLLSPPCMCDLWVGAAPCASKL